MINYKMDDILTHMEETLERVRTKGSELRENNDFKGMVFTSRKKTANQSAEVSTESKTQSNVSQEFDIKKATKEIMKFGAGGFYQRRREKTLKTLAVELGAKPEKKRYHNYKVLKEIRKQNCHRREERKNAMNLSANFKKCPMRSRKHETGILNKYGKRR